MRRSVLGLCLRSLRMKRSELNELLSSHQNLTTSHYYRLAWISSSGCVFTVTVGTLIVVFNLVQYFKATGAALEPWRGWADSHFNFSRVDLVPAVLWRSSLPNEVSVELPRWLTLLCSFVFFGFFGFAGEARSNYRSAVLFVAERLRLDGVIRYLVLSLSLSESI